MEGGDAMDTAAQSALALLGRLLDRGLITKETWASAREALEKRRGQEGAQGPAGRPS